MNFVGEEYYKLNRRLLLLVGLWPYEHSSFKYCQMILCNAIIIFTTTCQIIKVITLKQSDIILKLFSPIILCLIYIIKYQTFCIVARKIRYLMDHVEEDWNILKDKKELEIIERYTYIGSVCTFSLTILGSVAIFFFFFFPLIPKILDIIAPLNVSRPQELVFPGEYFVDQQKFFYALILQISITMGLILTTLIGTESLYVTYVQHACGMFQIASYRMDQAFSDKLLQGYTTEKQAIIICKRIIEAIYLHKRALESVYCILLIILKWNKIPKFFKNTRRVRREAYKNCNDDDAIIDAIVSLFSRFSEFLWSTLAISYSILLIIGVTSLIVNLFCLVQAVLFVKGNDEIGILILFVFGHIVYLFVGNYVGQILIDHSAAIFQNTYITRWQGAPLRAQKLLPIIMQRSMRSCKMVVGGMFVPSLEGFATLMSTTLSYFTVLWSVQK